MRPEAEAWWDQAQADLQAARANLEGKQFYLTAFLAQQSTEKGLKAVWVHRKGKLPPKTHNLLELAEELSAFARFETGLLRLNPQFVVTRYPDAANGPPWRNYNKELAERLLRDAEEVVAWCNEELAKPGSASSQIGEDDNLLYRAKPELASFVYDFAKNLREAIGAEKVILFGSRARGDAIRESDYDFVVVSPSFDGVNFVSRPVDLYRFWKGGPPGVELLCYTPEEFERKANQITIVREAVREGIEL